MITSVSQWLFQTATSIFQSVTTTWGLLGLAWIVFWVLSHIVNVIKKFFR